MHGFAPFAAFFRHSRPQAPAACHGKVTNGSPERSAQVRIGEGGGILAFVPRYEFRLDISPDGYLDYYRGLAKVVVVSTACGQTLQFPARFLLPFVSTGGIAGDFAMTCDASNKCVDLQRVKR